MQSPRPEELTTDEAKYAHQARRLGVVASLTTVPLGGLAAWGAATSTLLPWLLFTGAMVIDCAVVTLLARRLGKKRYGR